MTPGWRSKEGAGRYGVSHWVNSDGTTACAARLGAYGMTIGELMKTGWRDFDPDRHMCRLCLSIRPGGKCACGRCRVVAVPA